MISSTVDGARNRRRSLSFPLAQGPSTTLNPAIKLAAMQKDNAAKVRSGRELCFTTCRTNVRGRQRMLTDAPGEPEDATGKTIPSRSAHRGLSLRLASARVQSAPMCSVAHPREQQYCSALGRSPTLVVSRGRTVRNPSCSMSLTQGPVLSQRFADTFVAGFSRTLVEGSATKVIENCCFTWTEKSVHCLTTQLIAVRSRPKRHTRARPTGSERWLPNMSAVFGR